MLPGILIGILSAFQIDLILFLQIVCKRSSFTFGFIAGSLCFFMWLLPLCMDIKFTFQIIMILKI